MDHAPLLRYCVVGTGHAPWEERVRAGEWLARIRSLGLDVTAFQTYDPTADKGRGAFVDTPAALVWRWVEAYWGRAGACPGAWDLDRDTRAAFAAEVPGFTADVAQTLLTYLTGFATIAPDPAGFDIALRATQREHDVQFVRSRITQAASLCLQDPEAAAAILAETKLPTGGIQVVSLKRDLAPTLWERYREGQRTPVQTVRTGYLQYDQRTHGFWPGDMVMIIGRSSFGKSFLSNDIERRAMEAGKDVLHVSGEMTTQHSESRIAGLTLNIDPALIRRFDVGSAEAEQRLAALAEQWAHTADGPGDLLFIDRCRGLTCNQLHDIFQQTEHRRMRRIDLLVIDPIYALKPNEAQRTREEQFSEIARNVKELAMRLERPVIVTHQRNRPSKEGGGEGFSTGGDLVRYADAMVDEADTLLDVLPQPDHRVEVLVRKQRGGENNWSFHLLVDLTRGLIAEDAAEVQALEQARHTARAQAVAFTPPPPTTAWAPSPNGAVWTPEAP